MTPIKAVLFDLDGTLLDTAPDLGKALNGVLQTSGLPALSDNIIRPFAGSGSKGLLKLGLNIEEHDPRYLTLTEQLLNFYQEYLCDTTQLFPGMEDVLSFLEQNQIPWGVVTNKPAKYTDPLMKHLNLTSRAVCIISGDTLQNRKPHPEPILHACSLLKQHPKDCLYVGDSEIDIIACKAAGSSSLAALYGYIPTGENPLQWQADGYIKHPLDILNSFRRI